MHYFLAMIILFISNSNSNFIENKNLDFVVTLNFAEVNENFLTGKNDYYNSPDFKEIPADRAYRTRMFLLNDTYNAFEQMHNAAKKDGITLKIISATRTFDEQKNLWEDKWNKNADKYPDPVNRASFILQFNSMPGTSRHHWGTEIDLNSLQNSYFESGAGQKTYEWLVKNASQFGFCQTYNDYDYRMSGYQEEKWHWSYYPISDSLLVMYKTRVKLENIANFSGVETAKQLNVLETYILNINYECN